jgi:hypothetical protein
MRGTPARVRTPSPPPASRCPRTCGAGWRRSGERISRTSVSTSGPRWPRWERQSDHFLGLCALGKKMDTVEILGNKEPAPIFELRAPLGAGIPYEAWVSVEPVRAHPSRRARGEPVSLSYRFVRGAAPRRALGEPAGLSGPPSAGAGCTRILAVQGEEEGEPKLGPAKPIPPNPHDYVESCCLRVSKERGCFRSRRSWRRSARSFLRIQQ